MLATMPATSRSVASSLQFQVPGGSAVAGSAVAGSGDSTTIAAATIAAGMLAAPVNPMPDPEAPETVKI